MARLVLSPGLSHDFERILSHLLDHAPESATERVDAIISAFDVLETSPQIGRPVEGGVRELIIGSGSTGDVARYRYASELDTVFVLTVRGQRAAGYREH